MIGKCRFACALAGAAVCLARPAFAQYASSTLNGGVFTSVSPGAANPWFGDEVLFSPSGQTTLYIEHVPTSPGSINFCANSGPLASSGAHGGTCTNEFTIQDGITGFLNFVANGTTVFTLSPAGISQKLPFTFAANSTLSLPLAATAPAAGLAGQIELNTTSKALEYSQVTGGAVTWYSIPWLAGAAVSNDLVAYSATAGGQKDSGVPASSVALLTTPVSTFPGVAAVAQLPLPASGTFTPSITSAVVNSGITLSAVTASGTYDETLLPSGCLVRVSWSWSGTVTYTDATGILQVTGLPKTRANDGQSDTISVQGALSAFTWPLSATQIGWEIAGNHSYMQLRGWKSAASPAYLAITAITSGSTLTLGGSGIYKASTC